jgi:hypothetical protein
MEHALHWVLFSFVQIAHALLGAIASGGHHTPPPCGYTVPCG